MSLASRLSKLQVKVEENLPSIDHYTREQLGEMTIDFGKTHRGRSYRHMWEVEQEWCLWLVQHYGQSTNMKRRLVIKYIEMQVDMAENWNHKVPVYPINSGATQTPTSGVGSMAKAKAATAKAKSLPMTSVKPDLMDNEEFDMLEEWELQQHLDGQTLTTLQGDVMSLQDRMVNMENMLQQVLAHLQPKAAAAQAEK